MMPAAKHLDPVVGVDIHIILIPSPAGPIPTPLPHPFVGIIMDPFDYAPIIGATVFVGPMPRAQAGTAGIAMPPHIPMGGPFAKPPGNECEMFMGSTIVEVDGDAFSYLALPALSCHDIGMVPPFRPKKPKKTYSLVLPTSVVLPIPAGPPVLIGGPPTISLMALGMRIGLGALGKGFKKLRKLQKGSKRMAGLSKKLKKAADKVCKKLNIGDVGRNRVNKAICTVTGHPVDVATGKVFTEKIDFELPGPIPFSWERTWYSTSTYEGPLGHGWHHSYDMGLYFEEDAVLLRMDDGRFIAFPQLAIGQEHYERAERLTLFRDHTGYGMLDLDRLCFRFSAVSGSRQDLPLVSIHDRTGEQEIHLGYNRMGWLNRVVASGGQELEFLHDDAGRITCMKAPHPEHVNEQFDVVNYRFDDHGDLVEVIDPLGNSAKFRYESHLMVQETDRNGLSFYFEYDSHDETARCVHTWGDGGIYDHKLSYEEDLGLTVVENSLGHKTEYYHQGGLVTCTVDARGAATITEYNEHSQVVKESDALGNATSYVYDERGNTCAKESSHGSKVTIGYDNFDNPTEALDTIEGKWKWRYDNFGRLVERHDPHGGTYLYKFEGSQLNNFVNPNGERIRVSYDSMGNVDGIHFPNGAASRWQFDRVGHAVLATNSVGVSQRVDFDLLGRVTRIEEPDGNVRKFTYNAEGSIVRVRDKQKEIYFEYQGMGRMSSRREEDTTIRFHYDTEEQLTSIINENSLVYGFSLDSTGEVAVETGFDGMRRLYSRDLLGRIVKVKRPGNLSNCYEYDATGKIRKIIYSDGTSENFEYRADGELIEAVNGTTKIELERDALGRIVKESQGGQWVTSEYDGLGQRIKMESSLGASQEIERNTVGDVTAVSGSFEARFKRNAQGQELSRELPGGIRSQWKRDKLGRPVNHEVWAGNKKHRSVSYVWNLDDRLAKLLDEHKGPTQFGHDPLGNLAWAQYPDGSRELRVPDSVGNLYKTENRNDRKYGAAGQLLESTNKEGQVTRYEYDAEINLTGKIEPGGRVWRYHWNAAGMLAHVDRPDGKRVWFSYDALGRRLSKTFRGKTTHWLWDGNNPLHEWVQDAPTLLLDKTWDEQEIVRAEDKIRLVMHPPTGPPESELNQSAGFNGDDAAQKIEPITWLFEPDSFAPMAKLVGSKAESIVTDHLGTPVAMLDEGGLLTWSAQLDTYGDVRVLDAGSRADCPFRFPGQYEDVETGLYYNRFRYYDPDFGGYVSQDPIGLDGGLELRSYARDPLTWIDPFGLKGCRNAQQELRAVGRLEGRAAAEIERDLLKRGFKSTSATGGGTVWTKKMPKGQTAVVRIDPAVKRNPAKGYADEVPHAHKEIVPTAAVNKRGNFDPSRATKLDDAASKTTDPALTHIPIEM